MHSLRQASLRTALSSLLLGGCVLATSAACDAAKAPPAGPGGGPLYAVMFEVFDDTGSTSYLSLLHTLELENVDLSEAREYPGGRAFVQAADGALFVGDPAAPVVTRFSVADNGELVEQGRISFAPYGLESSQFDSWNVTFISPEKAYLMDFREGTTILWNPTTMEILGDIPADPSLLREGLSLEGSPAIQRDNLLFRTFNWVNYDDATYSTDLLLAIYDTETDKLLELIPETRCPVPGNLVHQDEAGSIYFSNWIWPVAGALMRDAPSPCVLRINPDENRFDPAWTFNYADALEGREGAMFTYLEDGRALVAAFYDERTSFNAETDPWSYVGSLNWKLWNVDIEGKTGAPVQGLDFNGGAFTPAKLDGRLFVMVPGGAAEGYATQIFELKDDVAVPRVKLPGWSYQFVKLR